jgi:phosphatidylglycerophosphate synthase
MSSDTTPNRSINLDQIIKIEKSENIVIWLMYKIIYPLAKLFVYSRVSPNTITVLSLLFVALSNLSLINNLSAKYFLCSWLIAVFLDLADGLVARISNRVRRHSFGFDHTSDLIKTSVTLISFGFLYTSTASWILVSTCICAILMADQLNAELSRARASGSNEGNITHNREYTSISKNIYTLFFTFNTHTLLVFPILLVNRSFFMIIISYFIFLASMNALRFIYLLIQIPRPLTEESKLP